MLAHTYTKQHLRPVITLILEIGAAREPDNQGKPLSCRIFHALAAVLNLITLKNSQLNIVSARLLRLCFRFSWGKTQ